MKFNIFVFCLLANFFPSNAQANGSGEDIQPISEGLQPTVRIKGKQSKLSSLKERMSHYKVPAVSIAFLKDNKISWTHTEGVIDLTVIDLLMRILFFKRQVSLNPFLLVY